MPDQVVETLQSLAHSFSIKKTAGASSHKLTLELLEPSSGRGPLTIVENLLQTVIKNADVDVSWVMKDVRFATSPIADQVTIGGQPILSILTPGLTFTEAGAPAPTTSPGVAGLLSALKGKIPVPIQETVANPLNIAFDVQWKVIGENGQPASDVSWTLGTTQGQGGSIPLQAGQALVPLVLSFLPAFSELTLGSPLTSTRTISVSIRLTATNAGGAFRATSGWVDLPPIDLILPVIPVPTMAFFFSAKFGGDLLIAVPSNSPLEEATFMPALDQLNNVLALVDPLLTTGALFLNSLSTIKNALSAGVTKVVFRKGDNCPDLRDVKFARASFWDWNGEDGDDHFATLILVGPPGRRIECFNDRQLHSTEGQFNLTLDAELWAAVWSMASKAPGTNPPTAITVPVEPNGRNWGRNRSIDKFQNELSSYRFAWA